jgi:hypothetical protein
MRKSTSAYSHSAFTAMGLLASLLMMGGCNQSQSLAQIEAEVQSFAVQACGFLPLASTIAAILSANASLPASAIAAAVCQAVSNTTPPTDKRKEAQAKIIVNGREITVQGFFVR